MSDGTAVELPPPPPQDAGAAIVAAAELLWPAPATVSVSKRGSALPPSHRLIREHLLAPNAQRPRLVVPARARRAAAAIAVRRNGSGGATGRMAAAAAAAMIRGGIADRVVSDRLRITAPAGVALDDVESQLADVLGTEVIVGLHVGTARVNRKPVLHAVDHSGRTRAFVKVGHSESARALVRREAATLRELAEHSFSTLQVPTVLELTAWRDMELLVLSPLAGRPIRPAVENTPYAAIRELAAVLGVNDAAVAGSGFLARLREIARALRPDVSTRYVAALDAIGDANATLTFGCWHGDLQPFNMARLSAAQVAVWDWERFATGLPVGVDALHYLLQVLLQKRGVGDQVAQQFLAQSKDVVSRAGANTETAAVTTAAYLAEIAGRYLSLAEGPDGELLARRAHWTLGVLESAVARL